MAGKELLSPEVEQLLRHQMAQVDDLIAAATKTRYGIAQALLANEAKRRNSGPAVCPSGCGRSVLVPGEWCDDCRPKFGGGA